MSLRSSSDEPTPILTAIGRRAVKALSVRSFDSYLGVLSVCCALIVTAALGILAVRSAVRLETRWDELAYHIPFAALRGGVSISYVLNDHYIEVFAGFPPLPHLVQGLLWRLTGSVNATGTANYLAFCAFLLFCHFKLRAPFWLVALIALTAPLVLIHTTVSYVDLFGNSFLAMGVSAFVAMYLFDRFSDRSLLAWAMLGLVAAAWSKFLLVPPVVAVFAAFAVAYLTRRDLETRTRFRCLVIIGIAILVATMPYAKNLILYGNPFWPMRPPIFGNWMPYASDPRLSALWERPVPLADRSQVELFVRSLFEIDHPTSYPNRPRWVIDQGNAWISYRSGGFWNISVAIFLVTAPLMAILVDRRKGLRFTVGAAAFLLLAAALPQSHELRYYLFLPLSWAATIGMLFPKVRHVHPRVAFCSLLVFVALFSYMCEVNRTYYHVERIGWVEAAQKWGAFPWWSRLRGGFAYCAVGVAPIGILLTGPTMTEFFIIDRSDARLCPEDSTILRGPR